jgi:hypothetical protein
MKQLITKCFFLFIVFFSSFQITLSQSISESYPLSIFIADSIDYSKIKGTKCKWEVYTIAFKLNKKGMPNQIMFSDSIPDEIKSELTRLLKLTTGKWDRQFLKKTGTKKIFVMPIINELISDCIDKPLKVFYSGIDSSLDNQLSIYKSISATATTNLAGISESFQRILQLNSESFKFLKCILLSPCRIKDKTLKRYRE